MCFEGWISKDLGDPIHFDSFVSKVDWLLHAIRCLLYQQQIIWRCLCQCWIINGFRARYVYAVLPLQHPKLHTVAVIVVCPSATDAANMLIRSPGHTWSSSASEFAPSVERCEVEGADSTSSVFFEEGTWQLFLESADMVGHRVQGSTEPSHLQIMSNQLIV